MCVSNKRRDMDNAVTVYLRRNCDTKNLNRFKFGSGPRVDVYKSKLSGPHTESVILKKKIRGFIKITLRF